MHSSFDIEPSSGLLADKYARAHTQSETYWFTLTRMIGCATATCIGAAVLVHEVLCEMANAQTHWFGSLSIATLAMTSVLGLLPERPWARQFQSYLSAACVLAGLSLLAFADISEGHRSLCLTLLGINLAAFAQLIYVQLATRNDSPTNSNATAPMTAAATAPDSAATGDQAAALGPTPSIAFTDTNLVSTTSKKPIWMRNPGWILLSLGFVVYMIVVPTISLIIGWFTPVSSRELTEMTLLETLRLRTVSGVVTLMFFCIGASIGSFLNVVIFRLPRSLPLLWPPSACGNCKTKLSGKDNIPIIGWLKLGGQCRYCGIPIAARYPIVESIVALVFVLFFFRELLSGGVNLPMRTPNYYHGIVWILLYTKWDLVSLYFFHTLFLCLLLAWGLINHDRFRIPVSAIGLALISFVGLTSIFPHLNPTHAGWATRIAPVPASLVTSVAGCIGGWLIGLVIARFFVQHADEPSPDSSPTDAASNLEAGTDSEAVATSESNTLTLPTSSTAFPVSGDLELQQPDAGGEETPSEIPAAEVYGARAKSPSREIDMAASLALVGSALGVETTLIVALLASFLAVGARLAVSVGVVPSTKSRVFPATVFVFVAATIVLFFWDAMHGQLTALIQPKS